MSLMIGLSAQATTGGPHGSCVQTRFGMECADGCRYYAGGSAGDPWDGWTCPGNQKQQLTNENGEFSDASIKGQVEQPAWTDQVN